MLKIGVVGCCGHLGQALKESRNRKDVCYVACAPGSRGVDMSGSIKKMTEISGQQPVYYEDYTELLQREKPDLLIVDNFYAAHAPVSIAALKAGCAVYSEKPVAASLAELDALREAVQKAGTAFTAMLNYRYYGSFFRAHQLIEEGKIGEVRLLNAQKSYKFGSSRPAFTSQRATYGGTIPWVGIHAIDWIRWMSGKEFSAVTAAQSTVGNRGYGSLEMTALAEYRLTDGVLASLTVDFLNPAAAPQHGDDRIRVVGTEGVLEVRGHSLTVINGDGDGLRTVAVPEDGEIFADFLDQIQGKGCCRVSAEDAFAATEGALRAQLSADENRTVLF